MAVGIKTIVLINNNIPGVSMTEGVRISGRQHKLVVIEKGKKAHFKTQLYNTAANSNSDTLTTKWVMGAPKIDGTWQWNNWSCGDQIPMKINGQKVEDYAAVSEVKIGNTKHIGKPFWLEAFLHNPEMPDARVPKGVYTVVKDKPQIIKSVFTKINHLDRSEKEVGEQQVFDYGELLRLEIHTHCLDKKDEINIECSIDGKTVNKGRRHTVFADDLKYNGIVTHDIYIDPKWKEQVGHSKNTIKKLEVSYDVRPWESIEREERKREESLRSRPIDRYSNMQHRARLPELKSSTEKKPFPEIDPEFRKDLINGNFTFKVSFKGNRELIEKRSKTVANMVSLGDEESHMQNDHPCKYTSVLVTEIGKKSKNPVLPELKTNLFGSDEEKAKLESKNKKQKAAGPEKETRRFNAFSENGDGTVSDNTETDYCVVAGKEKNIIKIRVKIGGHETGGCTAYNYEHDKGSAFEVFKANAKKQWIYPNAYEIKGKDEMDLDLTYPYLIRDNHSVLKYFWPASLEPQQFFVPLRTCAYPRQGVRIMVYPDMQWAISFTYGEKEAKSKEEWRKDLSDERKEILKETGRPIREMIEKYEKKLPAKLQTLIKNLRYYKEYLDKLEKATKLKMALSVKYDDTNVSFDDACDKIMTTVFAFAIAIGLMDEMVGSDVPEEKRGDLVQKNIAKLGKLGNKVSKSPVTIKVHNPNISFGGAWGREVFKGASPKSFGAPLSVDMFVKADPLFKAEGNLDVITCCEFLPAAGQAIKVVRMVLESAGVEPVLKVTAKGEITVGASGTIHFDDDENDSKLQLNSENSLKFIVEASITANGGLAGFLFAGGDWEGAVTTTTYKAYAETGLTLDLAAGGQMGKGPYLKANLDFSGLVAVGKKVVELELGASKTKEGFRFEIIKKTPLLGDTYYFN